MSIRKYVLTPSDTWVSIKILATIPKFIPSDTKLLCNNIISKETTSITPSAIWFFPCVTVSIIPHPTKPGAGYPAKVIKSSLNLLRSPKCSVYPEPFLCITIFLTFLPKNNAVAACPVSCTHVANRFVLLHDCGASAISPPIANASIKPQTGPVYVVAVNQFHKLCMKFMGSYCFPVL